MYIYVRARTNVKHYWLSSAAYIKLECGDSTFWRKISAVQTTK